MNRRKNTEKLTTRMLIAIILAVVCGLGTIVLREHLLSTGKEATWTIINNILFADISAATNDKAIGLFYIIGRLFVKALQLIIIPMVFTSIILAIIRITDSKKLGRIASKTIGYFLGTTVVSILLATAVGILAYNAGAFRNAAVDLAGTQGTGATNPLMIVVNAVPDNLISALGNNTGILAVVVCALSVGLAVNSAGDRIRLLPGICEEISLVISKVLTFVVEKFGPVAIFCLITRACAAYGVSYLKPAVAYMLLTVALLLLMLTVGYACFVKMTTGLNPLPFCRKTARVALFGFSTSSSAATLPLNMKTTTEHLGVHEEIASFVLPLGMTVNMDGTAIMQVIATIFIAGCSGVELSLPKLLLIGVLAIIASIGTPASPGAGAVILFTILSGAGINNEYALIAYSLVIAINRPIEMLVTALNVVGDSACAVAVAKSEEAIDLEKYRE